MCMIALKESGAELPKEEHLRESSIRNKDGIGIAYWKFGTTEVKIKKNFADVNHLIPWLKDNIKKEDACVIHFRLATHGLVDEGNRHPFPITKNKELLRKTELICQSAVAHNGVISEYQHAKFSDTQKFVLDILSDETVKGNYKNAAIKKLIENFLNGDRLIVLNNDGTFITWGKWCKEGGIYYSNSGYKEVEYNYNNSAWGQDNFGRANEVEDYCAICGTVEKLKGVKYKDETFLMCKKCRVDYSKGKIKLSEYYGLEEEEPIFLRCESCNEWVIEKELIRYYGTRLCKKCFGDIPGIGVKGA